MRWEFEPFLSKGQGDIRSVDENGPLTLEVIEHAVKELQTSGLKSKSEELKAEYELPFWEESRVLSL